MKLLEISDYEHGASQRIAGAGQPVKSPGFPFIMVHDEYVGDQAV